MCVGIDCGWPQRASGNAYKSNGGVTTATYQPQGTARTPRAKELMQELKNKIASYDIRMKNCYACQRERTRQLKRDPNSPPVIDPVWAKTHDCRENHHGKHSKPMEWTGALAMALKVVKKGIYFETTVTDDDATTKAHLTGITAQGGTCEPCPPPAVRTVTCLVDKSHRTRTFASAVHNLVDKPIPGEIAGDSRISKKVAAKAKQYHGVWLTKRGQCDDPNMAIARGHWMALLHHLFDDHHYCAQYFECRALKERAVPGKDYVPDIAHKLVVRQSTGRLVASEATYGKRYLSGEALFVKMKKLWEHWSTDAKLRESLHKCETQINEGMNRGCWSKAPKDRDYSGSSSFAIRVSLRVGEQNCGLIEFHRSLQYNLNYELGCWGLRALEWLVGHRAMTKARRSTREAKARRRCDQVLSSKEAYMVGRLDYRSGQHHHSGVTTEDCVRAVVNRLVARVAFLEGEPFEIVALRPSQRRCADVMATPRANAQPKLLLSMPILWAPWP
eukprot:SAG11_NODE_205_length_12427_cov_8.010140_6_plen_502_part_00